MPHLIITLMLLAALYALPSQAEERPNPDNIVPGTVTWEGMSMVYLPEGCFRMGRLTGDRDAQPEHEVCLNGFYIGKYEVTQKEWQRVMKENPAHFDQCGDNCPVEKVSWNDIVEFLKRLNDSTGRTYRLPTEAEWEYACSSGGQDEEFCGGNRLGEIAWFISNSNRRTHPVGGKKANPLGIYDMSGNVWEWVLDWKGNYPDGRRRNPAGPEVGSTRVRRGGSWHYGADQSGRSWRSSGYPDDRALDIGFRLAHSAEQ